MNHHYFASNVFGWAVSDTIDSVLRKLRSITPSKARKGTTYILIKVPLPQTAEYDINNFVPQVEGTELIESAKFK